MTMEELLKSLQKKCRVECEEAHRQLVCALNGLAGIHIIRGDPSAPSPQDLLSVRRSSRASPSSAGEFVEAAEMYREVLRSSEEHKDRLKTDSLQVRRRSSQTRQHPHGGSCSQTARLFAEASRHPQPDGAAECKAFWDSPDPEGRPAEPRGQEGFLQLLPPPLSPSGLH